MKRKTIYMWGITAVLSMVIPAAFAEDVYANSASSVEESIVTIQPRADQIVYKFRLYKGKRQYRRWNETRNRWVDPDWIDFS